jgi:hypothetical protein
LVFVNLKVDGISAANFSVPREIRRLAGEAAEALAGRSEETLARHLHDVLTSLRAGGQA